MMKKNRLTVLCQNLLLKLKTCSGLVKITLVILILNGSVAVAQVGVHTDFPDASSAMDIYATNKGLLIPRLVLTGNLSSPSPVTSPATGLLIFNIGTNQPPGFYYWSGLNWVPISGGSSGGNFWGLSGNPGTIPGTNFLGTTDNNHLLIYTNNTERMRFENDGQVVVGATAPQSASHVFTVYGNSTQNYACAAYAPYIGFYSFGGRYGVVSQVDTASSPDPGFAMYAKNTDVSGYGLYASGSNVSSLPLITSHTAGMTSYGFDGLHAWGRNTSTGHGICAIGSGQNSSYVLSNVSAGISAIGAYGIIAKGTTGRGIIGVGTGASVAITNESEGGAFAGFHGVYARGIGYQATPVLISGIGVIGVGYNQSSYTFLPDGISLGGSFTGDYGVYGKGLAATGVGVVGVGSNGGGYFTITGGSGGTFAGYHGLLSVGVNANGTGVTAAGNNASYVILPSGAGGIFSGSSTGTAGFGMSPTSGIGVIGGGNNSTVWVPSNGCGGAFTGNTGVLCRSTNETGTGIVSFGNNLNAPNTFVNGTGGAFTGIPAGIVGWATSPTGTGIIGAGNNLAIPLTYGTGSGGAFTGTDAGAVGYGTTAASGVGVIGAGNNVAPVLPGTSGCGGAFTGFTWGVYGFATNTGNNVTRGGGYFACNPTNNGAYAYCGYRNGNTNYKTIGNGTNSTIVKNRSGELITLYCPEAPEVVFQDYGIGQLVNGYAHITIDPDLAININVGPGHPLKVYITPEGDCMGVYVTNKSPEGFDVIELQGGKSNIPFAWQIVATRANEETVLRDGSIEKTVYDQRFGPAPGPLEFIEMPAQTNQVSVLDVVKQEKVMVGKESLKQDQSYEEKSIDVRQDEVIEVTDDLRD